MDFLPKDVYICIFNFLKPDQFEKMEPLYANSSFFSSNDVLLTNYINQHHPRFLYRVNEGLEWATKYNNRKLMSFFIKNGAGDPAYQLFGAIKGGHVDLFHDALNQIVSVYNKSIDIQKESDIMGLKRPHEYNYTNVVLFYPYKKKQRCYTVYNLALCLAIKNYHKLSTNVREVFITKLCDIVTKIEKFSFTGDLIRHFTVESFKYLQTIVPKILNKMLMPIDWYDIADRFEYLVKKQKWDLFQYCITSISPIAPTRKSDWITGVRCLPSEVLQCGALSGLALRGAVNELYQLVDIFDTNKFTIERIINSLANGGHHRLIEKFLRQCNIESTDLDLSSCEPLTPYEIIHGKLGCISLDEFTSSIDLILKESHIESLIADCSEYDRPDIINAIKSYCLLNNITIDIGMIKVYINHRFYPLHDLHNENDEIWIASTIDEYVCIKNLFKQLSV